MPPVFNFGDVVEFKYHGRYSHDPNPVILITHPNWSGKIQGININYLTELQLIHLLALSHPDRAEDLTLGFPAIRAELKKIGKVPDITKPLEFYGLVLENPSRRLNVYRQYFPNNMSNVQFRTAALLQKYTQKAEEERKKVEAQAQAQQEEYLKQQEELAQKEQERIEQERQEREEEKEREEEIEQELDEARKRKKKKLKESKKRKHPAIKRAKRKK